jgi:hypothetical protein
MSILTYNTFLMQETSPMAYNPQISTESSRTLRRIAWALKIPMTRASEDMISHMAALMDKKAICDACRDKTKCTTCFFAQMSGVTYIPHPGVIYIPH